ncbi:hypothetical protein GCM10029978_112830 [Actinoallomurus acanthiterrae]
MIEGLMSKDARRVVKVVWILRVFSGLCDRADSPRSGASQPHDSSAVANGRCTVVRGAGPRLSDWLASPCRPAAEPDLTAIFATIDQIAAERSAPVPAMSVALLRHLLAALLLRIDRLLPSGAEDIDLNPVADRQVVEQPAGRRTAGSRNEQM